MTSTSTATTARTARSFGFEQLPAAVEGPAAACQQSCVDCVAVTPDTDVRTRRTGSSTRSHR
ncbi:MULTISPECIES: hypothetical protein [unclassified Streptomyces]|uniref:hypothetical protein n=1 Tax=unclassified Streptomyces TaxID=2593676 RepID=UPI0004C7A10C|nr:hypothetical protein [Streptomyces sp. NRRL F-2747]